MADLGQKISELEAAAALDGSELLVAVQSGSTKKSTAAAVETYIKEGLSKSDVGLSNVANERQYSASNPPPTPSAADVGAIPASAKGAAGGVAELDNAGLVPSTQLPSYVDDVLEFSSRSAFPVAGESGKIYVAIDTSMTYRWSGSTYVEISNPIDIDDTLSVQGAAADAAAVGKAILATYPTGRVSGAVATLPDGADGVPVKSVKVQITAVQEGSGTPSSSNIRPISGVDGATVTRVGKNLCRPILSGSTANKVTLTVNPDGSYTLEGEAVSSGNSGFNIEIPFRIPGSTRVSFSLKNNAVNSEIGIRLRKSSLPAQYGTLYTANEIDRIAENVSASFNAENVQLMAVTGHGAVPPITLKPQLELGAEATEWAAYTEEAATVSWEEIAGTVYGGELDLTSGVLTVTHGYIASYAGETLPGEWMSDRDVYAEGTSPSTGAQVVYELAVPASYPVQAAALHTVLGVNHIFADCGDVSVEYRADITAFVNKKVAELQALILENT